MDPTLPGDPTLGTNGRLEETLRALARDDAALRPAPAVEAHLRARVRALRRDSGHGRQQGSGQEGRRAPATWRTWAGAVAAGLLFVLIWRFVPSRPPDRMTPREVSTPEVASEFLPLPYAHVPVARGQIVRMPVPRSALAAFGFDPGPVGGTSTALNSTVLADVFVGEDGIARSVRFVAPAIHDDAIQEDSVR